MKGNIVGLCFLVGLLICGYVVFFADDSSQQAMATDHTVLVSEDVTDNLDDHDATVMDQEVRVAFGNLSDNSFVNVLEDAGLISKPGDRLTDLELRKMLERKLQDNPEVKEKMRQILLADMQLEELEKQKRLLELQKEVIEKQEVLADRVAALRYHVKENNLGDHLRWGQVD